MPSGKFSQQTQATPLVQGRATRTERLRQIDETRKKEQEIDRIKREKFGNIRTLAEYEREYNQLSPEYQQYFVAPSQLFAEQKSFFNKQVETWQSKLEQARADLEHHNQWWDRKSSAYRKANKAEHRAELKRINVKIDEYQSKIDNLKGNENLIYEGYDIKDLVKYAEGRAEGKAEERLQRYETRTEFKQDVSTGKYDETRKMLGLPQNVSLEEYNRAVKEYNRNLAYQQQKSKYEQQKWQQANPTEKLIYDDKGNLVAIQSGIFEKTVTPERYSELITTAQEQNKKSEAERRAYEKSVADARKFLEKQGFGKDLSFERPKETIGQGIGSEFKALYLASPFGMGYNLPESQQKELSEERQQATRENVAKIGSIPLETAQEYVEKQEDLDYKSKQATKALEELDKLSTQAPPELKPYIQAEGLKILEKKGLEVTETTEIDVTQMDTFGNYGEKKTLTITDPAFERRISENALEWEREIVLDKTAGKGFFQELKPTSFRKFFLETRIVSSKTLETYGVVKAVSLGIQGAVAGTRLAYSALGGGLKIEGLARTGTFSGKAIVTSSKSANFLTQRTIQLAEGSVIVPRNYTILKSTFAVGLTGVYGYAKYRQYQTYVSTGKGGASLFALETAGELGGIEGATGVGRKAYQRVANRVENFSLKTMKMPDISQKGFLRMNKKLGFQERVYMERYSGAKLSKPRTWLQAVRGYRKGQFTGRQYKLLSDEVRAYYEYGGDVQLYREPKTLKGLLKAYKANKGKGLLFAQEPYKIIKAEPFPYDAGESHVEWFMRKNYQQFGLGKYSKLPINVKGKAFGYSATGEAWTGKEFDPNSVFYIDKNGIVRTLKLKGALQYYSGKGVSAGFLRVSKNAPYESMVGKTATRPIIYAGYFNKVQVNRAIREIKGIDIAGRELKAYIYSADTGEAGTLNIPLYKKEVEGTVEIAKRIPIRTRAIKFLGWKVPVQEQFFGTKADLSTTDIKNIIKEMGTFEEFTGVPYSSLPSRSSGLSPIYAFPSYAKKSSSYSAVLSRVSRASSRVPSSVSASSTMSQISRVSVPRKSSSFSYPSQLISEIISRSSRFDYPSTPSSPKSTRSSLLISNILGKGKSKRKLRIIPETLGLFPDFTARALGLEPKQVSLKQALKDIAKIQTGFEVRTGAGIKGMSERDLMKGVIAL